jgi:hypothetical protein
VIVGIPQTWGKNTIRVVICLLDGQSLAPGDNPVAPVSTRLELEKRYSVASPAREHTMNRLKSGTLMLAVCLTVLPIGVASAAGGGAGAGGAGAGAGGAAASGSAGATGAGVGAAGTGSAAVGGGAPAGRVGGGPPAGQVGGGPPGSNDAEGNGAAGTGNPALNATGQPAVPSDNPAAGLENAPTTGGVIGGNVGAPPNTGSGAASPPVTGQAQQDQGAPKAVQGVAEQPARSTVGLAEPGADGVSTKTVAPRPCSTAAHETDGTTTCVGVPAR